MANRTTSRKQTRRGQARQREAHWRKRLAEWSNSGLTQRAFCQQRGLSLSAFHWWKAELVRRDAKRGWSQKGRCNAQGWRGSTPGFLPVRVVGSGQDRGIRGQGRISAVGAGLEVVLGNGRRVRVASEVGGELLAKVVRVLEGLPW